MSDPYATLGLERTASDSEVKAAYRRAAKKAHPDAPGGSREAFLSVKAAYELLRDPDRRRRLDQGCETILELFAELFA